MKIIRNEEQRCGRCNKITYYTIDGFCRDCKNSSGNGTGEDSVKI